MLMICIPLLLAIAFFFLALTILPLHFFVYPLHIPPSDGCFCLAMLATARLQVLQFLAVNLLMVLAIGELA